MWVVMMVTMILPSLVLMLWRYRQAVGRSGETRLGRLTALVGVGYFFVWTVFGMAAFPLGVALAAIEMQLPALARAVPIAVGGRLDRRLPPPAMVPQARRDSPAAPVRRRGPAQALARDLPEHRDDLGRRRRRLGHRPASRPTLRARGP
jgi:Predicted metal-binding integral membrane protein (DUF2182)